MNTGVIDRLMATAKGVYAIPATFARWVIVPIVDWFSTSIDEAGERVVFLATSSRYPPAKGSGNAGVELPAGVKVATPSVEVDGKGNGMYRLNQVDESAPEGEVLPGYRKDEVGKVVWEETMKVWERAVARST